MSGRQRDEIAMASDTGEVFVGSEQRKSVLTAGGGNQEVDRAGIDTLRTAAGS
jgi:hypothetical protein